MNYYLQMDYLFYLKVVFGDYSKYLLLEMLINFEECEKPLIQIKIDTSEKLSNDSSNNGLQNVLYNSGTCLLNLNR